MATQVVLHHWAPVIGVSDLQLGRDEVLWRRHSATRCRDALCDRCALLPASLRRQYLFVRDIALLAALFYVHPLVVRTPTTRKVGNKRSAGKKMRSSAPGRLSSHFSRFRLWRFRFAATASFVFWHLIFFSGLCPFFLASADRAFVHPLATVRWVLASVENVPLTTPISLAMTALLFVFLPRPVFTETMSAAFSPAIKRF